MENEEAIIGHVKPYPPLGILSVSAYLKSKNLSCEVLDTTFMKEVDWEKQVLEIKPDVIAFYVNLMTKKKALELVSFIKRQNVLDHTITVAGGPDTTYNIQEYLDNQFDYLVIGEGELTFYELIMSLDQSSDRDQLLKRLQKVNGIAFKETGNVVKTLTREKLKNMDDLPFPDREAIDIAKYLDVGKRFHGRRILNLNTQRGCPYTCKWCSTAVYGQSYRRRSPEKTAREIKWLTAQYGDLSIWFVDDVFTVSHKWIKGLHQIFQEEGIFVPFECITRAERLDGQILHLLKEMGCFRIWIGAESGSQAIIDAMDRKVNVDEVASMIQKTNDYGIETGTFIMLGYPGETEKDIMQTANHLINSNPKHFTVTLTYPIKGTSLFQQLQNQISMPGTWAQSTDRDLDFKRTYRKAYYKHAIRFITHRVEAHRERLKNGFSLKLILHRSKYLVSRLFMKLEKTRS